MNAPKRVRWKGNVPICPVRWKYFSLEQIQALYSIVSDRIGHANAVLERRVRLARHRRDDYTKELAMLLPLRNELLVAEYAMKGEPMRHDIKKEIDACFAPT